MNSPADFLLRAARWVRRFRHRRGYGVHSPFAFGFITGVIYERGEFYAYASLRVRRKGARQGLRERDDRLMLRLANACGARTGVVWGRGTALTLDYLRAGRSSCRFLHVEDGDPHRLRQMLDEWGEVGLLFVDDAEAWTQVWKACLPYVGDRTLFVVRGIRRDRAALEAWRRLKADGRVRVTFDLHDFGLAWFERRLNKEDYIVNYW